MLLGSGGVISPECGSTVGAGNGFCPGMSGGGCVTSAEEVAAQLPLSMAGGRGDLRDGWAFQLVVWNSVGASAP